MCDDDKSERSTDGEHINWDVIAIDEGDDPIAAMERRLLKAFATTDNKVCVEDDVIDEALMATSTYDEMSSLSFDIDLEIDENKTATQEDDFVDVGAEEIDPLVAFERRICNAFTLHMKEREDAILLAGKEREERLVESKQKQMRVEMQMMRDDFHVWQEEQEDAFKTELQAANHHAKLEMQQKNEALAAAMVEMKLKEDSFALELQKKDDHLVAVMKTQQTQSELAHVTWVINKFEALIKTATFFIRSKPFRVGSQDIQLFLKIPALTKDSSPRRRYVGLYVKHCFSACASFETIHLAGSEFVLQGPWPDESVAKKTFGQGAVIKSRLGTTGYPKVATLEKLLSSLLQDDGSVMIKAIVRTKQKLEYSL